MKAFQQFELNEGLIQALESEGIQKPTSIQERLILPIQRGKDVIGQSQTGTGKTLSFLLPIVNQINPEKKQVQAVITAPTRELANQLFTELEKLLQFAPNDNIKAKRVIGGTDRGRGVEQLKNPPHIVIATPGRLNDMVIKEQVLDVHETPVLVVDEADQMLDMGFIELIDQVAGRMPDDLQMLVFSATVPEMLQPFLKKYMNQPRHVQVEPEHASPLEIDHFLLPLKSRERLEFTTEIAKSLRPYLALVFANTKQEADELFELLHSAGLNVDVLHGGLKPRQRKQVMRRLNEASVQYVVATDLAARGMDIEGVSHVINTGLPKELTYYVHRSGRTGRAGATGEVFTIVDKQDEPAIEKLMKEGITFRYTDLKKNEWRPLSSLGTGFKPGEKKRQKPSADGRGAPKRPTKKPKQVKPGYKKKHAKNKKQRGK
ncbi:DEAD/DEAH box helicase [Salsuginibacillus kocurii]|uniref:DEAD/DEAH box helicase n=1 Tax=Salsuginibacillus kocurii TaxID=427078 RepID=UPI0003669CA0|nr:DEAD/DEAH box helicase [Salsuginibacillus kocurii]